MSAYTENGIYTRIANAIETVEKDCRCYSRYTETVERFPAAFIYALDITEPQRYRTFAGDGSVWSATYEVQLFSNLTHGAKEQIFRMARAAGTALHEMAFRVTSARPLQNGDPIIYRYVIRASRLIGGGDEMPEPNP